MNWISTIFKARPGEKIRTISLMLYHLDVPVFKIGYSFPASYDYFFLFNTVGSN